MTDPAPKLRITGSEPDPAHTPKPRPRNPLWETVAFLWFGGTEENGWTVPAGTTRTRCGRIVRELQALGATPKLISERIVRYRSVWPNAECTPEAIIKHWDRFGEYDQHKLLDRARQIRKPQT